MLRRWARRYLERKTTGRRVGFILAATLVACNSENPKPGATKPEASLGSTIAPSSGQVSRQALETVDIPTTKFLAGSAPDEPQRHPSLEMSQKEVELGPFRIDRLAYPNDPAKPPRTGVTREEALMLCAARKGRLCSELEWELACKGSKSNVFPTGATWDKACLDDPTRCSSAFGVLAMGTLLEWTASDVIPEGKEAKRRPALRGATDDAAPGRRRCASRKMASRDPADPIGFRCCYGAPNALPVTEPNLVEAFRHPKLKAKEIEDLLSANPKTQEIANDIQLFRSPEAANTVVARGDGDKKGFSFTVAPLLWNPAPGVELLLIAARSGEKTSFVVAFHRWGKERHKLAASYIMRDEPGPVALAYSDYIRPRLHFSTCWGCLGETGKILHRKPNRVAILQP